MNPACMANLIQSLFDFPQKEKTQETDWQTTTVELKFITSTSCPIREIKHRGMLSRWNHYIPPTLFSCTAGGSPCKRRKKKKERFYDGLSGGKQGLAHRLAPELSGPVSGHLSSGVQGSWGYPQRHSGVKWVTVFEVRPAVISPNIQQMSGISIR